MGSGTLRFGNKAACVTRPCVKTYRLLPDKAKLDQIYIAGTNPACFRETFMKTQTLTLAALLLSGGLAYAEEVRVYNWSDYIDEELLAKFEAETGINLIYDVFDSNEVLETKMLAGGSGYDVVVPSGTFLQRQIVAGASNYVYYANGNAASKEFLVEDVIGDPAIYPDEKTLENLYTTTPYPAKVQRVVTRLWTKIKSGT